MTAEQKLKPCPFCGEDVIKDYVPAWGQVVVFCKHCNYYLVRFTEPTKNKLHALWNTRAEATNENEPV